MFSSSFLQRSSITHWGNFAEEVMFFLTLSLSNIIAKTINDDVDKTTFFYPKSMKLIWIAWAKLLAILNSSKLFTDNMFYKCSDQDTNVHVNFRWVDCEVL